ncbi:NeuD/PglB/VioB family sugar acetyltransferase [Halobacillus halophilus]|uniref:NeuD/PglB/VioB family sugar acetyltransferase n=1 Tax=Halobacillus halophilus TaxID=1570 RepID=UPI001CD6DDD7|nr:NeuD/PglB/VioB family sugar acetyltransferase [Halobacillus halophilus]
MKRILDLLIAGFLTALFFPLMCFLYVLVKIKLGDPVIFTQERPGLKGHLFKIYKFRTMTNERDAQGRLLPDDKRLTRLGKTMRAWSLDEIPQFFNVLKGDLSLVGPRPLLKDYLSIYNEEQARRHEVKPGITGWAQVNGRNALTWEDKFKADLWYVENRSTCLDLFILAMTISNLFKRKGVNHRGTATMPVFEKKKVVIIGAGAQGGEILETINLLNQKDGIYEVVGFVDDNTSLHGSRYRGVPVLGPVNILVSPEYNNTNVICSIGNPSVKKEVLQKLEERPVPLRYLSIIHPASVIAQDTSVGRGTYVAPNVVLSNNVSTGDHVLINYGCTVGHDSLIGDYCSIYPGTNVSGEVHIHEGAEIGCGSSIVPGLSIGAWTVIGAGAAVINSIPAHTTSVGVPAKVIKNRYLERKMGDEMDE